LEKRFIYGELNCFLGVGNNVLEEDDLTDKATRDMFALFWEAMALQAEDALFPRVRLEGLLFYLPGIMVFIVTFPVAIINGHCLSIYILE